MYMQKILGTIQFIIKLILLYTIKTLLNYTICYSIFYTMLFYIIILYNNFVKLCIDRRLIIA